MEKLDLRQQYKSLYNPSTKKVEIVDVPPLPFAMIDGQTEQGQGPAESSDFEMAVGALYSVSYTLKFMIKKRAVDPVDYPVMALEGLWDLVDPQPGQTYDPAAPAAMSYRLMIMQPEIITPELWATGLDEARRKKPNPALDRLRLERFHEGLSVQTMHLGPYATEPETFARMDAFCVEHGYERRGHSHHEIYLSDPGRTAPEKVKTILRYPVRQR